MSKTTMIVPSAPKTGAFNSHTTAKWSPIKSADHKIASPAGAGMSPFGSDNKSRNDKYGVQSDSGSNWGPFKNREHFNQMHFC